MRPTIDKHMKYTEIVKQIALLDMKRAEYLKILRTKPEYAKQHIEDVFKDKIQGKFFNTLNTDKFYRVNSCNVNIISMRTDMINECKVELKCTLFENGKKEVDVVYNITSPELPKNIENWLSLGNKIIPQAELKKLLRDTLLLEKKRLDEEKKLIELRIKELDKYIS